MTTMTTTTGTLPSMSGRRAAVRTVLSTVERLMFRGDAMVVARANAWSGGASTTASGPGSRAEAWAALADERDQRP